MLNYTPEVYLRNKKYMQPLGNFTVGYNGCLFTDEGHVLAVAVPQDATVTIEFGGFSQMQPIN